MTLTTTTHLNFRGDARAALEFYGSVFDGPVTISTYREFGMPAEAPGSDGVVFGAVASDSGFRIMAYDVPGASGRGLVGGGSTQRENGTTHTDQALFVSLTGESLDEVRPAWDALGAGATIVEPLAASAWSAGFGMLTDRFGVTWSIGVAAGT